MAGFRSNQESQKWASLQAQEKLSLTRITQGKGTPQDFKQIQSVISQYDKLAGTIMDRALEAIDQAVNVRIAAITGDREHKSKPALTAQQTALLMDHALKQAWDQQGPELVVVVEESMVKALKDQDKRLDTMFGKKLQEHLGDPRDSEELTLEDIADLIKDPAREQVQNRIWAARMEEFRNTFSHLTGLEDRVAARAELALKTALRRYFSGESEGPGPSLDSKNPKGYLKSRLASEQVHDQPGPGAGARATLGGSTDDSTVHVDTSRKFEQIVEEAIEKQGITLEQIRETLADLHLSDSDRRARDEEQAEALVRAGALEGGFGDRTAHAAKSGGVGLMAGLAILGAKLLLSEIMGGTVWEEIKKLFSANGIEDFGKKFLTMLESAGHSIADYIADQFKSTQEKQDQRIGVTAKDSDRFAEAKRKLYWADKQVEVARASHRPESEMGPLLANQKAAQDYASTVQLEEGESRQNLETEGQGRGHVGPPEIAGAPNGGPTTSASTSNTPANLMGNGTSSATGSATPALGTGMMDPLTGGGRGVSLTSSNVVVNSSVRTNMTAPVTGPAPATGATPVAGNKKMSQAAGGSIASITNMCYRPSIDGSMGMANVGMMVT